MGIELYKRVFKTFEIRHLSKCFNIVMRDIIEGRYDTNHIDQAEFKI